MKLSIIVPVYNVKAYLSVCIESLLAQDIFDYEIVLVDDGSTDGSSDLCDLFEKDNEIIRVIHKANGGSGSARNAGLEVAQGEYVLFIDSDDYILEHSLKHLLEIMESNVLDILLFSGYSFIDEGVDISSSNMISEAENFQWTKNLRERMSGMDCLVRSLDSGEYITSICLRLFKKALILEHGLVFGEDIMHEDEDFGFLSLVYAEAVEIIPDIIYFRRYRPGSIMMQNSFVKSCEGVSYAINHIFSSSDSAVECDVKQKRQRLRYCECLLRGTLHRYEMMNARARREARGFLTEFLNYEQSILSSKAFSIRLASKNPSLYVVVRKGRNLCERIGRNAKELVRWVAADPLLIPELIQLVMPGRKKRVLLLGTPTHGNIGDHLIAMAEMGFMRNGIINKPIEIMMQPSRRLLPLLKRMARTDDIIAVSGGGWLGTSWRQDEDFVRNVVATFPDNRIVIFPQTIYYRGDPHYLNDGKSTYSHHHDLWLCLRDQQSFDFVKREQMVRDFSKVRLMPDMALYYGHFYDIAAANADDARHGIGVCLRNDVEQIMSTASKEVLLNAVARVDARWRKIETNDANIFIGRFARKGRVNEKLREIGKCKLLVTDRLHAMIIAALTKTPCIAFNNATGKVAGVYAWLAKYNFIRLVDSTDGIDEVISDLLALNSDRYLTIWNGDVYLEGLAKVLDK